MANDGGMCPRTWSQSESYWIQHVGLRRPPLHCELCKTETPVIYICNRCQIIICHACWYEGKHQNSDQADRDEGKPG